MYNEQGNILLTEGKFDHEKGMNEYINSADDYAKYLPEVWKEITEEEIRAGHGGMDTIMLKAFFDAAKNGKEMPIDVYDAASAMVVSCLSEASVAGGGKVMEIPDFTNGKWLLREPKDVEAL